MKKTVRILSLMLVFVMALSALVACGGDKDPADTKKPIGPNQQVTVDPKWDGVNFDGEEIIVGINETMNAYLTAAGSDNGIKYIQGPDGYTTDSVQNAVYDRNIKVTSALGINPKYIYMDHSAGGSADYQAEMIESYVLADLEDSPDLVAWTSYGLVRAGIKGQLYNALTKDEKANYFDIKFENGWYEDFMYENTLDKNKLFILAGDYFVDVLRYACGVMVNIDMYNDLFASEGGIESLYETVEAGAWDYDELERTAAAAHIDSGVIGTADDADTFGIVSDYSWYVRNFFCSAGLDVFEEKDGKISYIRDIGEIHTFVDKLLEIAYADYTKNPYPYSKTYGKTEAFIRNGALFNLDSPLLTLEGTNIRNMNQKVGILPYPKYYSDASYKAMILDGANTGGILYNSDKFVPCSAFVQLMCEESNGGKGTVIYEYYEVTLKYKYTVDPGQIRMLEIIREGVCSPKAMLYDNYIPKTAGGGSLQYREVIDKSLNANSNTFTSDWESQYDPVQKRLEEVVATFGDQE